MTYEQSLASADRCPDLWGYLFVGRGPGADPILRWLLYADVQRPAGLCANQPAAQYRASRDRRGRARSRLLDEPLAAVRPGVRQRAAAGRPARGPHPQTAPLYS